MGGQFRVFAGLRLPEVVDLIQISFTTTLFLIHRTGHFCHPCLILDGVFVQLKED